MTLTGEVLAHLAEIGCTATVEGEKLVLTGPVGRVPVALLTELRRSKPAIRLALLRKQVAALVAFIDGEAPLTERLARLPQLLAVEDRLSAAQDALWAFWRQAGFKIVWSNLLEEFILVGDGAAPPGSEGIAVYTWAELEALKDATPERVQSIHKIKKAFNGVVRCAHTAMRTYIVP